MTRRSTQPWVVQSSCSQEQLSVDSENSQFSIVPVPYAPRQIISEHKLRLFKAPCAQKQLFLPLTIRHSRSTYSSEHIRRQLIATITNIAVLGNPFSRLEQAAIRLTNAFPINTCIQFSGISPHFPLFSLKNAAAHLRNIKSRQICTF